MISDEQIVALLNRLALNYSRTLDEQALVDMAALWRQQIGNCLPSDVQAAAGLLVGDPQVRRFPTVAEFRTYVVKAAQERHQEAASQASLHGEVACTVCMDSGWVEAGTDDRGYEYVNKCPNGCLPPLPGARFRAPTTVRRREADQQSLSQVATTLPDGVIDAQHRMVDGSHADADTLQF